MRKESVKITPQNINHTFVICAYKVNPFLKYCIKSLKNQTVKPNIIMVTSTPNSYIERLSNKYSIPLMIRIGKSNIRDDWNFAYDNANTEWVTVAHQDDIYSKYYLENLLKKVNNRNDILAVTTDYLPIDEYNFPKRDINCIIRKILRFPLKYSLFAKREFWKRAILSLGNSICCPTVTYNKSKLRDDFFTSELKYNIDWDTFLKISSIKGEFAYIDKPLVYYRISDLSTSKKYINNSIRKKEDTYMFSKFWPQPIVNIIMSFYTLSYNNYR